MLHMQGGRRERAAHLGMLLVASGRASCDPASLEKLRALRNPPPKPMPLPAFVSGCRGMRAGLSKDWWSLLVALCGSGTAPFRRRLCAIPIKCSNLERSSITSPICNKRQSSGYYTRRTTMKVH